MSEFEGLDLQAVESQLEESPDEDDVITPEDGPGVRLVLDILDGSTPDSEWIELVESGAVLVLNVEGDMNTRRRWVRSGNLRPGRRADAFPGFSTRRAAGCRS